MRPTSFQGEHGSNEQSLVRRRPWDDRHISMSLDVGVIRGGSRGSVSTVCWISHAIPLQNSKIVRLVGPLASVFLHGFCIHRCPEPRGHIRSEMVYDDLSGLRSGLILETIVY